MSSTEKILFLMESGNVTAKELTQAVGLSSSAISEWKKGKAKPSAEAIVKIASFFDVSTDYLLIDDYDRDEKKKLLAEANSLSDAELEKALEYIQFLKSQREK